MEENNSPKEYLIVEKNNIDECLKKFENHILDNINDFDKIKNNLTNLSLEGKIDSELVRSFSYKIFLNTLSSNKDTTLKKWLQETLSQRNSYKENLKRNKNMESSEDKEEINENENEAKFQDINIFKEPTIKKIEKNILVLFQNKDCKNILDMLIFSLYPFYIKSDNKNYNEELFEEWANEPKDNVKDIYNFFHDEDEFESDLYHLMDNIMKLGINKFYEPNNDKNKNYLSIRTQKIIDKLKIHNNKLYNHFKNIDFDINIILQKWLKNFFSEEFSPKDCSTIWDLILANEAKKSSGELIYIDYFCISMLDSISEELLKKDKNECEQRLLSYPFLEKINILISLADKIKSKENNNTNNDNKKKNSSTATGPGSMANFLYSANKKSSQTKSVKTPNLMFGGEYSNRKGNATLTPNVNQANNNKQVFPKKIPMFENIKNNSKNNNKTNSNRPSFELTKGYTVSNSENLKMLHELKGLIDIYINEFSNDDKMKVSFLIDNLSKEL